MWRMPAEAPILRALDSQKSIFLWLPFFCCFRQKKVTRRFSGGTLLILLAASKLQSFEALEPLKPKARSTAFVRKRPSYFLLSKATKER
ncbi:hypothetical protein IEQ11_09685 [Lysobacter capsici]|uniref:hypothetical protein n=1 Tax=Lysobacter capsici TaxID=435897 RepID=UPI001FF3B5AA|nr:hypothetical protein [Lysobacter capsici]UOF16880.1 hypothetical protein IEQ11_09685 [Lysobacter capsici]